MYPSFPIKIKNKILEQEQKLKKSLISNNPSHLEGSDDDEEAKQVFGSLASIDELGEDAVAGTVT
jgi:hypothetical protein